MDVVLEKTRAVLDAGLASGLQLGAQVFVSHRGKTVADFAVGAARADGSPMTRDTLNLWMSSVKPVAAVAIAQIVERGNLAFDDRVSAHLPEFGVNGKDVITVRHLLTHTGGFRAWPNVPLDGEWDDAIAAICASRIEPNWVPGEKAGYHPRASWMILGELVRVLDPSHRTYDRYVRDEVFQPLKVNDSSVGGMRSETYRDYGSRIGAMFENILKNPPAPDNAQTGVPTEAACALVRPGSGGRGPMRDLARFYQMLMNGGELDGARVLSRESVREITRPQRIGLFDHTFKAQMDWGLGFILNSQADRSKPIPYGYGRHASAATFGHSGAESSCAFCDPENQLVVAWVCNGMPGEAKHQARQIAINEAIYKDVVKPE